MRFPVLLPVLFAAGLATHTAMSSPAARLGHGSAPQTNLDIPAPPLFFEENRGQAPEHVRFLTRAGKVRAGITGDGSLLTRVERSTVRMELAGRQSPRRITGLDDLPTTVSYFRGSDPAKWLTGVPAYRGVRCSEVYPGVDLLCYGADRRMEYDLVVAPGADPAPIRLRFSGQQDLRLDATGRLHLRTADQELIHERPVVYQPTPQGRRPVQGEYVLLAGNEVGFRLGPYDPTSRLVIDPVVTYLSYLGGSGDEGLFDGLSAARDAQGNLYVGGSTSSLDFPVVGAYQNTNRGGTFVGTDAFVAKLSPDGSQLLYATYLGGAPAPGDSGDEWKVSLAVDAAGSVVVAGATPSPNFPLTPGAFRTTFSGSDEGFVTRLAPAGNALVSSTFIGGNQRDWPTDVTLDGSGKAVVVGLTESTDWVTTPGVVQSTPGGFFDAFLVKVAPNGTAITLSTLLGGSTYDHPLAVAVDATQNLYLAGFTESADFPTANALQPVHQGGFPSSMDGFVTKLNPTASAFVYSTFLGASLEDAGVGLAVDGSGQATIVGRTTSPNFPTTPGAYQPVHAGDSDAFVSRLSADGSSLAFSTFLGAAGSDIGFAVALGGQGQVYVAGSTTSTAFPSVRAVQPVKQPGTEGFVAALSSTGAALTFSTYLGGAGEDTIAALLADADGQLTAVGYTTSPNLPVTAAFQSTPGGGTDVFLARLAVTGPEAPANLQATGDATPAVFLTWEDRSPDETGFALERAVGAGSFGPLIALAANQTSYHDTQVALNSTYRYRVRATGPDGASPYSNTAQVVFELAVPTPPSDLTVAAATADYVDLAWSDTSSTETGFHIERDAGLGFLQVGSAGPQATGFRDQTVQPNTIYEYRVRAANAAGASAPSNTVFATTPERLPAAPANLRGRAVAGTRVDLTWSDVSQNESGFRIERSTGGEAGIPIGEVGPNITAFSDPQATLGGTFTYRVRAFNSAGASSASNPLVVQVPSQAPAAPTGVTLQVITAYNLRVSWTDRSTNETTFQVSRREGTGAFLLAEILPADTTSFIDRTVQPRATYTYRVQASNSAGISAAATSTTLAMPAPGKLTVTPKKLNFAATLVGRTARKVVTLRNTGKGPLRITLHPANAPFEVEAPSGELILAPRAKRQIGVRFSPTEAGSFASALPVVSEANPVTVPLTGKGR